LRRRRIAKEKFRILERKKEEGERGEVKKEGNKQKNGVRKSKDVKSDIYGKRRPTQRASK
jgi:hypothetical protein